MRKTKQEEIQRLRQAWMDAEDAVWAARDAALAATLAAARDTRDAAWYAYQKALKKKKGEK